MPPSFRQTLIFHSKLNSTKFFILRTYILGTYVVRVFGITTLILTYRWIFWFILRTFNCYSSFLYWTLGTKQWTLIEFQLPNQLEYGGIWNVCFYFSCIHTQNVSKQQMELFKSISGSLTVIDFSKISTWQNVNHLQLDFIPNQHVTFLHARYIHNWYFVFTNICRMRCEFPARNDSTQFCGRKMLCLHSQN